MYNDWRKADTHTTKMLPVESDVPELLVQAGREWGATELDWAIGDLVMIAFCYLLCIGEYTVKSSRNDTKHTVQFKLEDITFFCLSATGKL